MQYLVRMDRAHHFTEVIGLSMHVVETEQVDEQRSSSRSILFWPLAHYFKFHQFILLLISSPFTSLCS